MYRLFVAVDLPDEIKKEVRAICRDLHGAHWVQEDQLHLTLRFIGDADEKLFQSIRDHLGRVKWESFTIELRGIGHFPPGKRARVLWVGVDAPEALHSLQRDVEQALIISGVPPEGRGFSPHITLARFREPFPGLTAPFEERYREFATDRFAVDAFHLYSSTLTGAGAIHRREATYTVPADRRGETRLPSEKAT